MRRQEERKRGERPGKIFLLIILSIIVATSIEGCQRLGEAAEQLPSRAQALVAYWKIDEGEGERISDETKNCNDGAIHGPSWVEGKSGYALQFDGIDDYVEVPHSDSLDLESMSFAAWIRLEEIGGRQILLEKKVPEEGDRSLNYAFFVQWNGDQLAFIVGDGTRQVGFLSDRGLGAAGEWHHVAVTFSETGDEVRFYIDGEPAGVDILTLKPYKNKGPLIIGKYVGADGRSKFHLHGTLDELCIYNKALTEEEVRELGHPNLPPTADFSFSPQKPTIQDIVRFTDLSTDPDGYIVYWGWDFGDGAVCPREPSSCGEGDNRNPTHHYLRAGTFTVKLTVIDNKGAVSRTSKEVTVSVASP
jgi:hypothetical protein